MMDKSDVITEIDDTLDIKCCTIDSLESCNQHLIPYNFRILSWNIRSQSKNFLSFMSIMKRLDTSFDALILSECWLTENTLINQLPGYNMFHTKKIINKSGGVIIYVKNSWSANAHEPIFDDANCLVVNVGNWLDIVGIYRSPSFQITDNFICSLDNTLDKIKDKKSVIVTGDINIDILDDDAAVASYQRLMAEQGLLPAITIPTRGLKCLDHAFVKTRGPVTGLVCNSSITDHDLVIVGINTVSNNIKVRSRTILKTDHESVLRDLGSTDWSQVTNTQNVD